MSRTSSGYNTACTCCNDLCISYHCRLFLAVSVDLFILLTVGNKMMYFINNAVSKGHLAPFVTHHEVLFPLHYLCFAIEWDQAN